MTDAVLGHYFAWRKLRLFAVELVAITLAALGGLMLLATLGAGLQPAPLLRSPGPWIAAGICSLALLLALYGGDLYDLHLARRDASDGTRLLRVLGIAVLVLAALRWSRLGSIPSLRNLPAGALLAAAGGAAAALGLVRWQFDRLAVLFGARRRIAILGNGPTSTRLAEAIASDPDATVQVDGFLAEGTPGIAHTLAARGVDTLVVTTRDRRERLPVDELLSARLCGVEVIDAVAFWERVLRRLPVDSLRPSDLIFGEMVRQGVVGRALQRAVHVAAGLIILLLTAPLLLLVAIAIKLDSRGPVFYRQERVGLGGRPFTLIKFRTMRQDAEVDGARWASRNDDRVTRVGRWLRRARIDEIPQILNVLRGDMALVGPRPERPEFVAALKERIPYYGLREAVPPGLTGWAQVKYPYASSLEEQRVKLEYDLYYVRHRSLVLDLVILLATVKVVLLGRGAR